MAKATAYGPYWSPAIQEELLAAAGFNGKTLENWLRDGASIMASATFGHSASPDNVTPTTSL